MKIDCVIGIDPGVNGGIAIYRPGKITKVIKMPRNLIDLRDWFVYVTSICTPLVFLEKLSVRPDDVTIDQNDNTRANMGKMYRIQEMMKNFEQLKVIMNFSNIPFVLVSPMKWQSTLKLRLKGVKEEKIDRKNRYKKISGELYPAVNVALWNSDALLIMHFGRYVLANEQQWVKDNLPKNIIPKLF